MSFSPPVYCCITKTTVRVDVTSFSMASNGTLRNIVTCKNNTN